MDWGESHELCIVDMLYFSLVKKESGTMGKLLHATHSADNQIWVVSDTGTVDSLSLTYHLGYPTLRIALSLPHHQIDCPYS